MVGGRGTSWGAGPKTFFTSEVTEMEPTFQESETTDGGISVDKGRQPIRDAQLVDGLKRNDPRAQEEFVNRFGGVVVARIREWVKNPADQAEIANDVFFKAMTKIDTYRPSKGSFVTWLLAIASNQAKDWLRKTKGDPQGQTGSSYPVGDISDVLHMATKNRAPDESDSLDQLIATFGGGAFVGISDRLDAAIALLKEREQRLIELVYFRELAWDEVYDALIPDFYPSRDAVNVSHHRIKKKLRQILRKGAQ